jgi:hypothetical protein
VRPAGTGQIAAETGRLTTIPRTAHKQFRANSQCHCVDEAFQPGRVMRWLTLSSFIMLEL